MTFSQEMSVLDHRNPPSKDSFSRKHTNFLFSFSFSRAETMEPLSAAAILLGCASLFMVHLDVFFKYSYAKTKKVYHFSFTFYFNW